MSRSSGPQRQAMVTASVAASRFRWRSTAPLGAPVVPEVKQISAGSSGPAVSRGPGSASGRSRSEPITTMGTPEERRTHSCLLYTSDAADEEDSVDLGG